MDDNMQGDACPGYNHTLLRPHMQLNKLHDFCVLRLSSPRRQTTFPPLNENYRP